MAPLFDFNNTYKFKRSKIDKKKRHFVVEVTDAH